jgi:hypothetical protein
MGETARRGDRAVTVSAPRVQRTFVYDNSVWKAVKGRADSQYLLVGVATEGFDRPKVSSFDVAVDGQRLDADVHAATGDAGVADGPVAFPVPVGAADRASVVWKRPLWSGDRWRVPVAVVEDLAAAPTFRLRDVTFSPADGMDVAAANVGDRDGTFPVDISVPEAADVSHVATWPVPAGERRTHHVPTDALSFARFEGGVTFTLGWGTGSVERSFDG